MAQAAPSVLLVDDDHTFLSSARDYARLKGCEVHTASTVRDAMLTVEQCAPPDLMLLDLSLPDGSGLDLLDHLDARDCGEIVVLTGEPGVDTAVRAMRLRVDDYVVKPMRGGYFDTLLQRATRRAQSRLLSSPLASSQCGDLLGNSLIMRRMFKLIERVAPTDNTVLVHGESGAGKELVARAIHQYSDRRGRFVAINCGAVPPDLIGSQLFGHERGSFTGAIRDHAGYFEQAQGGTLLLDEFTEMPMSMQTYLLRVLETRDITRIGARTKHHVDVRVIAACNRDPAAAVRDGVLREDLYYRLADFPIEVPPLRSRGDDAHLLAGRFLRALNDEHGTNHGFSAASEEFISQYAWPGNVRELLHAVRRAYLMAEDGKIELAAYPDPAVLGARASRGDLRWSGQTLEELEREAIEAALARCGNDKTHAARLLGVSVKTVYNKLVRYKKQGPDA
ncbi:sigma-54-dependent transcriptional regulator [Dyella jiangningensis]|nr:sigma-54 dependent transcriptional regulator [Dyella jiangningensis]